MEFLAWMESSPLSIWVRESNFGYYILLNAHAIGMALVVGVVLMLDLRLLGFARSVPLKVFDRLLAVGWIGFAVNFASGAILFAAQGQRYMQNTPFLIKIGLILLGGFTMWLLGRMMRQSGAQGEKGGEVGSSGRSVAFLSMVFWIGAIVAGRIIAYTLGPPPPPTL